MDPKDRLIIALDCSDETTALALAEKTGAYAGVFKVGFQLFSALGPSIVEKLSKRYGKVFLDLKFHDIPNTVGKASQSILDYGVYMFNVHASGGLDMMKKAAEARSRFPGQKPLAIAVTVLTSINTITLNEELGISGTTAEHAIKLAKLAAQSGLDGVVCSGEEIKAVKKACGANFKTIVPGVRPEWFKEKDDQKRVITPSEAIKAGADFIVVGRPITGADDPSKAARRVLEEISS
ncbi:MAG: orotidine-5'-phosphate decarboxylase [Candidatus Firestonebacteria bacterium]